MDPLEPDERDALTTAVAALERSQPETGARWRLSAAPEDAAADEAGNVHLTCTLVSHAEDGDVAGWVESRLPMLHVSDLRSPARLRAYLEALAISVPSVAATRGWPVGEPLWEGAFAELLPVSSPLDDLSLQTFDDFLEVLTRRPWLDEPGLPDAATSPRDLKGTEPVARDPAQEAELAGWPTLRWPWVKYARWLKEAGDPRGDLMGAHLGSELEAPRNRRTHERVARQLMARHAGYLLGPFAPRDGFDPFGDQVFFDWRTGFVERIELDLDLAATGPTPTDLLAGALALPSCRIARELVLGVSPAAADDDDRHPLPRWTDALVASGGHEHLRAIVIRGPSLPAGDEDLPAIEASFPSARVRRAP